MLQSWGDNFWWGGLWGEVLSGSIRTHTALRRPRRSRRRLAFTLLAAAPDSAQLLLQILDMLVEQASF